MFWPLLKGISCNDLVGYRCTSESRTFQHTGTSIQMDTFEFKIHLSFHSYSFCCYCRWINNMVVSVRVYIGVRYQNICDSETRREQEKKEKMISFVKCRFPNASTSCSWMVFYAFVNSHVSFKAGDEDDEGEEEDWLRVIWWEWGRTYGECLWWKRTPLEANQTNCREFEEKREQNNVRWGWLKSQTKPI